LKIQELTVKGYRSLRDVTWRPGDLNVLIGPNGGGKSNLLRVLQLIQAAADRRLAKWVLREGGMVPMAWDGSDATIRIEATAGPVENTGSEPLDRAQLSLAVSPISGYGGAGLTAESLKGYTRRDTLRAETHFAFLSSDEGPGGSFLDRAKKRCSVPGQAFNAQELLLCTVAALPRAHPVLRGFCDGLKGWCVWANFDTGPASPARAGTVARHETFLEPNGDNLVSFLHTLYTGRRDFERDLNESMRAAFGDDFEELVFPPEADQRIQLRVRWKSRSRADSAADLSDGTLRFLYLLAILANPKPPPLIAIDEPETGLHPAMQRIVAELATEASRRTQVVLTTHSPEFLDGFEKPGPTVTVVESRPGAGTVLRNLAGEALSDWLGHYTLGEILRSNEAEVMKAEGGE
jgi:predicted ATPase